MSDHIPRQRVAVLAMLHAKPGKEQEVEAFLASAQPLVEAETGTITWYALKLEASLFCIFDTFTDEESREAHLAGEVARALHARADDLFASPPVIGQPEILAVKTQGTNSGRPH